MTDITIVATTWLPQDADHARRRQAAFETALESWRGFLHNEGKIHLHLADDGSGLLMNDLYAMAQDIWPPVMGDVTYTQQYRKGVGASLNAGLQATFARGRRIVLYAVDDWELLSDLDLTPWAAMLNDGEFDAGMIRFFPHPWLAGEIQVTPHGWAIKLERHHFAFGFRPALFHQRMFDGQLRGYGWFEEGVSSFDAEIAFNDKVCSPRPNGGYGPNIWLALPDYWRPIETGSLAGIVPYV